MPLVNQVKIPKDVHYHWYEYTVKSAVTLGEWMEAYYCIFPVCQSQQLIWACVRLPVSLPCLLCYLGRERSCMETCLEKWPGMTSWWWSDMPPLWTIHLLVDWGCYVLESYAEVCFFLQVIVVTGSSCTCRGSWKRRLSLRAALRRESQDKQQMSNFSVKRRQYFVPSYVLR